ncbi:DivIVA domain-containing protein [Micromonospora sp. NPDC049051]|uniref:DivIVA domain-containing protein n=1 Tax=unclassified Micromonospora TaxID=2617518 RepID=UPI00371CB312
MGQVLLLLVVALTVAAVVFGVTVLVSGRDPGLVPAEPDGRAVPLPAARPLRESDVGEVRFDTALRGYRMAQVDHALRRAAYDIGYKSELIDVLEEEVAALREGRTADADALRRTRERAAAEASSASRGIVPVEADRPDAPGDTDVVVAPIPAFAGPAAQSTPGAGAVDRSEAGDGGDDAADRSGAREGGDDADRDGGNDVTDRSGAGDGGNDVADRSGAGDATGPVVGSEPR